jgi:hypothetical protein
MFNQDCNENANSCEQFKDQARRTKPINANKTKAPTVAINKLPKRPVADRPSKSKRNPPKNAPQTPTIMLPINPNP